MARQITKALRFKRVGLVNWRNFRKIDLHLGAQAYFVGPNASGKSNLLDAFRFLAELASGGAGGLQAAVAARGGFASLRCLFARSPAFIELDVVVGTEAEDFWRYQLRINRVRKSAPPTVASETVWRWTSDAWQQVRTRSSTNETDISIRSQTYLEQVEASRDFRELQEFLASSRYLHVVPQIVRDRERGRPKGDDPFGGDLLRRMRDMPEKTRNPRLRRIRDALGIAVPRFVDLTLVQDTTGVPHLEARYQGWRETPHRQNEEVFSDGTLRLIGLLWSMSEPGGPLLLEEPELSLNEGVVEELPAMLATMQRLSRRQVLLTTHSAALLAGPGIGLRDVFVIEVDQNGSGASRADTNEVVAAQVEGGMTIAEAVLPLLRPRDVEKLGRLTLAA